MGRKRAFTPLSYADTYYLKDGEMIQACEASREALLLGVKIDDLKVSLGAPDVVYSNHESQMSMALKELDSGYRHIWESLIRSGRIDLSVIINSRTQFAPTSTELDYRKLTTYVTRNGAVPRAIFGQDVFGSGAMVGMMMPKKIVLPDTTITLSLPPDTCDPEDNCNTFFEDIDETPIQRAQRKRDEYLAWLRSALIPNLPGGLDIQSKAEAWVDAIPTTVPSNDNGDPNYYPHKISGNDLANAGDAEMMTTIDKPALMSLLGLDGNPYDVIPPKLSRLLSSLAPSRTVSGSIGYGEK